MQRVSKATRQAACRWLLKLQESEVRKLRAVFQHSSSYADLTPAQYEQGLAWLRSLGLVTAAGAAVVTLGAKDLSGAEAVVARVLAARDLEARKATGDAGERALLGLLRAAGAQDVRHVAAESDSYGYDIEATVEGRLLHIECKATTDSRRLVVYLSRNEFETMRSDPAWLMVALLVADSGQVRRMVTVDRGWLESSAPADTAGGVRWESARYVVPAHVTTPGVVDQRGRVLADPGREVRGVPTWGRSSGLALLS